MANGNAVTTLSVATSETWKDKQTGERQERTEWHRVVFFNRLGEIAGEYARKGSKLYVEGSLRTRKWQDQQGIDRYTTEIVATEMQLLDSKAGGSNYPSQGGPVQSRPDESYTNSNQPSSTSQNSFEELDDDVPF